MSTNQIYSTEFRAKAVKLDLEQGLSQDAAVKRLSSPKGTLGNGVAGTNGGGVATPATRSVQELEAEIVGLRRKGAPQRRRIMGAAQGG